MGRSKKLSTHTSPYGVDRSASARFSGDIAERDRSADSENMRSAFFLIGFLFGEIPSESARSVQSGQAEPGAITTTKGKQFSNNCHKRADFLAYNQLKLH
jgi:hypothetical protein